MREPGFRGVFLHHARVAEDLAAADVEGAVDRALQRCRPDEVVQHVAHGDRLDLVAHPAGGGHQGQRLGQVPDHLERRRTGADHDAGLENDGVDRTVEEDLAHGFAGPHVGGELGVGGVQAAQVDDPVHAGVGRGPRRGLGHRLFLGFEARSGRHGVDQVVKHVDAVQGRAQGIAVVEAALDDLDVGQPRNAGDLGRRADQDLHGVPGLQQPGDQTAADVAGGAGDEHRPGIDAPCGRGLCGFGGGGHGDSLSSMKHSERRAVRTAVYLASLDRRPPGPAGP